MARRQWRTPYSLVNGCLENLGPLLHLLQLGLYSQGNLGPCRSEKERKGQHTSQAALAAARSVFGQELSIVKPAICDIYVVF